MLWGFKSRFHDLEEVLKFNPKMVEFHLTEEDVKQGHLNGKIYDCDYSIHLPEYWCQTLIDPCTNDDRDFKNYIDIYRMCFAKKNILDNNFKQNVQGIRKIYAVMHPGGMTIDKIDQRKKKELYYNLKTFIFALKNSPAIEILVENMPPLPWFYGGQYYSNVFVIPEEIVEFCEGMAQNICLDISHLGLYCNYVNRDLIECIKILLPYTKQIHLADAEGTDGEGANFGEGNIDFKKVIKTIKNTDCPVIPETMWGHHQEYKEFLKVIEECNKYL